MYNKTVLITVLFCIYLLYFLSIIIMTIKQLNTYIDISKNISNKCIA